MQASEEKFTKFISGEVTFVIPVYQRNYDWREADCHQLFNDIENILANKKTHFLGTFVYTYDPSVGSAQEYIIIDGQQRITSIVLFAKALYDLSDDEDLKADIRSKFIKHTTGRGLKNKCRLRPTEYDRKLFEKLMADDFDEKIFTPQEQNTALYKNYRLFREKISDSTFTKEELCDAVSQLNIVAIMLKDENPQEIFESLNSTGLALTKADLIRNFLLMPLAYDEQQELYKKYWLEIEKLLRASKNVENFLIQYLIARRKSDSVQETKKQRLSSRNLYDTFKKFFAKNFSDTETCLKDLYRYAKFFSRCIFKDDTAFKNLSALEKKFYELVYLLDAGNSPIILMYLLDRFEKNHFDEATFVNFVDALISLAFRAKICGHSGINPQFAGNVLARLDKENSLDEKLFWQAITFGKGTYSFPNDKDFQASLINNNLYETIKPNLCKYLLYSLEKTARTKELPAYSNATVEHVLPRKLNDAWKNYLRERNDSQTHEIWLHTPGNLTLTEYNSELGNKNFADKKKIYEQSHYSYTRGLCKYPDWTSKQIQARAQKLAAEAIKIWTLPEEFNSRSINLGDIFNLNSDFGALRGTKPASLLFFDTEIKISNWSDLLREVVKQLYALDEDAFRRASQMENVPRRNNLFATTAKSFRYEFKVDENYFMTLGLGTDVCLRVLRAIVENFDNLAETNFREDIYFTLRR